MTLHSAACRTVMQGHGQVVGRLNIKVCHKRRDTVCKAVRCVHDLPGLRVLQLAASYCTR